MPARGGGDPTSHDGCHGSHHGIYPLAIAFLLGFSDLSQHGTQTLVGDDCSLLDVLRGEERIASLCRREGIVANLYYRWSKEFLEAGKRRLLGDT